MEWVDPKLRICFHSVVSISAKLYNSIIDGLHNLKSPGIGTCLNWQKLIHILDERF